MTMAASSPAFLTCDVTGGGNALTQASCTKIPGTWPSRRLPAFSVAFRGGGGGNRQGAALGGLSLLLVG